MAVTLWESLLSTQPKSTATETNTVLLDTDPLKAHRNGAS
jgi:hypothetical protein